jgi:hypothetical protein
MSYYDDSSLFVAPNGYKTSVLFAQKPMDANGQLAFTRSNDTATRVGPDGLIEKVRTNLLLQSNTFNTTWLPLSGGAVTGGQAGYDGTNNAWLLSKSAAGGFIYQTANSFNGQYTLSIYAKANASTHIRVNGNAITDGDAFFNLSTGAIQSSTNCVAKIVSVGGGWYRCSITSTDADLDFVNIYPAEASGISATSGSVFIQNAQLETGDIATDYIPTTTTAVSVGPVANLPRIDYTGGGCGKLLLEPQRTNLITYSEQFNNAGWAKSLCTITANQIVSPSGYLDADLVTTSGTTDTLQQSVSVTSGTAYTFSGFIKSGSTDIISLVVFSSFPTSAGSYNLTNGTATSAVGSPVVSIQDYGNGWYRATLTATATSTGTANFYFASSSTDAVSTYHVWGAQLEAGSYASSYIGPTLGSASTRGADACSKTGISSLIGQTEGTLFAEVNANSTGEIQDIELGDGTVNNRVILRLNPDNTFRLICVQASSFVLNKTSVATFAQGENLKIAAVYKSSAISKMFVNGVSVLSATAGVITGSFSGIFIGSIGGSINLINSPVEQMILFPTALSDAEAIALTTL